MSSLVKKLLTKRRHTFDTLPDKVGVRVIIRYRADIDEVVERVRKLFDSARPENKERLLGTDRVGYLSVHLDHVRLHQNDRDAAVYPPSTFWVELQVRTLAQHLWSEMSHDTVYSDEMLAELEPDTRRRVALMAGQVELSARATVRLLQILEQHYYRVASRQPNLELSVEVLDALMPLVNEDVNSFANHLNESSKQNIQSS